MQASIEKRATVRVYLVDEKLNVLHGSGRTTLPAGLVHTVARLLPAFEGQTKKSQAVAISEGRVVRLIPVATKLFAVAVERFVSNAMLRHSIKEFKLSSREVDVLMLALEGFTAAESAARLELGISTVNDHLNHLLLKTGARNKTAMIAKVLGWRTP